MSNQKLPPGLDMNKVSKVDFNKMNQTMSAPQQQAPQAPQQQAPQQQAPQQQAPHYSQLQQQDIQQTQQVKPKPQNSPEIKKKINESHPVLKNLLNRFGLKKDVVLENKIYFDNDTEGGSTFLQSDYEEALETWALQEGQFKARMEGEAEGADWMQTLLASLSVLAINDTPLYEVFDIDLFEDEKRRLSLNKYDVSVRIRKLTAKALAVLLITELKGFAEKLLEFYVTRLKRENLKSSMDEEKEHLEQFMCPEYGCDEVLFEKPRRNSEGKKLPFYCKHHGTVMEGILNMGESEAPSN